MNVVYSKLSEWSEPPKFIIDSKREDALKYLLEHVRRVSHLALINHLQGRVAVIPSLAENSPFTVIECLALQLPFVGSDLSGIAELIHEEGTPLFLRRTKN